MSLLLQFLLLQAYGQAFLSSPVAGSYGKDYIIVNYVDWGLGADLLDYHCGNKTYKGHQGTDFVIRSFAAMDSGVDVNAAADGIVTFVQDDLFDREKRSDINKGFGNYITISHANGYYTYYAHLKRQSATVKFGDTVKAGYVIGEVGSSGNSTDPHLHFELWYDSAMLVDPFKGNCGNASSLWLSEWTYDTSFQIWKSSLCGFIPNLDTLREEPEFKNQFDFRKEKAVNYWNILYGLRKGDLLSLRWFTPEDVEWFRSDYQADIDYWFFYFWNYIDVPKMSNSNPWKAVLYRNNKEIDRLVFFVTEPLNSNDVKNASWSFYPNPNKGVFFISDLQNNTLEILDVSGRVLTTITPESIHKPIIFDYPNGIYFIKDYKSRILKMIVCD